MAAVCDPKLLPAQATCFHCADPGTNKEIQLYLFGALLGNASASTLSAGAATYRPITGKWKTAVEVYLIAVLTGNSTDPATLEKAAACWWCIPESERLQVSTYLLAVTAGASTDPKVLAKSIGPYESLLSLYDYVKIYALNFLAGGLSLNALMKGAACFMCLDVGRLEEIYLYLLCQGVLSNLIPGGSRYNGATEFDLVVLPNTNYLITWGANDLSVTICGTSYPSLGVGSATSVNTGACTLMQFLGTFGNTTVTVKVQKIPMVIPTPAGFTWTYSGGSSTASWNASPAGVFSVELWTSTNNVTFTLASTTAVPGTSAVVAGPAVGSTLYAKIRATSKVFPGYSVFTSVLSVVATDPDIDAWVARVVANGGATPSNNTKAALSTFANTLKGGTNVWSKILAFNPFVPDNLIAAITPVIKATGNDPWTNHNFVLADLTVNGLKGNGATKYLDTGLIADAAGWVSGSSGLFVYVSVDDATGVQADIGVYGNTFNNFDGIYTHYNNTLTFGGMYRVDTGNVVWTPPAPATGFYSLQRTGTPGPLDIYFANSSTPHASLKTDATAPNGAPEHTFPMFAFVTCTVGAANTDFSNKRYSAMGLTLGLSSADDATLYNAVQTLRTSLGGGFV